MHSADKAAALTATRTAAAGTVRDATIALLRSLDMTTVFGNPGSTELAFLHDWPSDFRYVLGLQESSVVGMADGYAQATGTAAFVNLHSAAGVGHALGSIYTAYRNQTPLVVTAGQQARALLPLRPFLGAVSAAEFPRPYVKWSCEPARAEDVPLAIAQAHAIAMQKPCGPTFVSIPADDWHVSCRPVAIRPTSRDFGPDPELLQGFAAALGASERPAIVVVQEGPISGGTVRPVLFTLFGVDVQTYGVSKIAAALLGAYLLGKAFTRLGLPRDSANALVMWATIWGFVGAKIYFLLEQMPNVSMHDLGGMGFTWYGGLVGGVIASLVVIRRHQLPAAQVAGAIAAPLSAAYAVGRLGCLVAGDGTYGKPTTLPWGMTFPSGVVATDVPVHPTPLYEALLAAVIAVALWQYWRRADPVQVFAAYLVASGVARFLVEMLRTNEVTFLGLTQPQLWAVVSVVVGTGLWLQRQNHRTPAVATEAEAEASPVLLH